MYDYGQVPLFLTVGPLVELSLVPSVVNLSLIRELSVTCLNLTARPLPFTLEMLLSVLSVMSLLTVLVWVRTRVAPLLVCRTVNLMLLSLLETLEKVLPTPARVLVVEQAVPTALPPAWNVLIPVRSCREVVTSPLLRLRSRVSRARRLVIRRTKLSWWASVLCVRLLCFRVRVVPVRLRNPVVLPVRLDTRSLTCPWSAVMLVILC